MQFFQNLHRNNAIPASAIGFQSAVPKTEGIVGKSWNAVKRHKYMASAAALGALLLVGVYISIIRPKMERDERHLLSGQQLDSLYRANSLILGKGQMKTLGGLMEEYRLNRPQMLSITLMWNSVKDSSYFQDSSYMKGRSFEEVALQTLSGNSSWLDEDIATVKQNFAGMVEAQANSLLQKENELKGDIRNLERQISLQKNAGNDGEVEKLGDSLADFQSQLGNPDRSKFERAQRIYGITVLFRGMLENLSYGEQADFIARLEEHHARNR